jgi:hypothetical protein
MVESTRRRGLFESNRRKRTNRNDGLSHSRGRRFCFGSTFRANIKTMRASFFNFFHVGFLSVFPACSKLKRSSQCQPRS